MLLSENSTSSRFDLLPVKGGVLAPLFPISTRLIGTSKLHPTNLWPELQVTEERGQVLCDRRRFLNWGEVPAAGKDCPALDVVHALQIRARRLALENGLVREDTERRGRTDVRGVDRVPAIVPIVAHRRGDGLRHPVQGERGAEEIVGR